MINGAHTIIYSIAAEADRAFFRDVLKLPNVDVGQGWLIFALPPSEVAVHPAAADESGRAELYLMVEHIEEFVREMTRQQISCDTVSDEGWGIRTHLTLPSGARLGVYQPRHARPEAAASSRSARTTK